MTDKKVMVLSGLLIVSTTMLPFNTTVNVFNPPKQGIYNSRLFLSDYDRFKQEIPKKPEVKTIAIKEVATPPPISRGSSVISNDILLMAKVIYLEAKGEPFEGKVAVGAVILNRVRDPRFPSTVEGVIYQSGQFSTVTKGFSRVIPSEDCLKASEEALRGKDPTNGCLYFWNPKMARVRRTVSIRIGNHVFAK